MDIATIELRGQNGYSATLTRIGPHLRAEIFHGSEGKVARICHKVANIIPSGDLYNLARRLQQMLDRVNGPASAVEPYSKVLVLMVGEG